MPSFDNLFHYSQQLLVQPQKEKRGKGVQRGNRLGWTGSASRNPACFLRRSCRPNARQTVHEEGGFLVIDGSCFFDTAPSAVPERVRLLINADAPDIVQSAVAFDDRCSASSLESMRARHACRACGAERAASCQLVNWFDLVNVSWVLSVLIPMLHLYHCRIPLRQSPY